MTRFMPVERDMFVTSSFGSRWGGMHWGTDFGANGGSGNRAVYACQAGTVVNAGFASGFGQWVVIDHPEEAGAGTTVYGHVLPEVTVGTKVVAGQRIARINPVQGPGNGNVPPHVHVEVHRFVWTAPGPNRLDPDPWLQGAAYPNEVVPEPIPDEDPLWADILTQYIGERR